MILLVKLLAFVTAATGAALSLFGDARKQGRLTATGKCAMGLVIAGFATSVIIELLGIRAERISGEWDLTLDQPIYEVHVSLNYDQPTAVADFANALDDIRFVFGTYAELEQGEPVVRRLRFHVTDVGQPTDDVEKQISLASSDRAGRLLAVGSGSSLSYREGKSSYVISVDKKWDSWDLKTVGVDAWFPFEELGLGESIRTVRDLSKLTALSVYIPSLLQNDKIDEFSISFYTPDQQIFILDLMDFSFREAFREKDKRETTIPGFKLVTLMNERFSRRGGHSYAIGEVFR